MNAYIERVIEDVKRRDPDQKEFIQTVEEVLRSLEKVVEQHPEYEKAGLLERLVERVPLWEMECTKDPEAAWVAWRAMHME
mgnify:CR=1 FL=1